MPFGIAWATPSQPEIPMSPDQVWTLNQRYINQRFDLVTIAFKKALDIASQQQGTIRFEEMARMTVNAADAVLAEMEKNDEDHHKHIKSRVSC